MSDAVYTRISKLLALANNTAATEAEAALAAEHVQRLLQEHNLTLSEVEVKGGSSDTGQREKAATGRADGRGAMYTWQRRLMAALAENNFCLHRVEKIWVIRDKKSIPETVRSFRKDGVWVRETARWQKQSAHQLVGRALNVRVTLDTYDYLVAAIARAAEEACAEQIGWFQEGAVSRLVERLAERRREAEQASRQPASGNGTHQELVLSDVYGSETDLNNDFLNGFPAGTTATKRREAEERSARMAAEHQRLQDEGMDWAEAWYRVHGYGDDSVKYATNYNRRSRRGGRGRSTNWTQSDEREYRKTNSASYQSGRKAGSSIGLDSQVGAASRKQIGGK